MKKRYIYSTLLLAGLQLVSSCGQEFLEEVEPRGKFREDSYYQTEDQAFRALAAAYDPVGWVDGLVAKVPALNSASDDHHAGGGNETDMGAFQAWDKYNLLTPAFGPQESFWNKGYQGIMRVNSFLARVGDVPMDEKQKNRFIAEAHFLRAFYYFDLIRYFYKIPKIDAVLSIEEAYAANKPQVERSEIFALIEADLLAAIPGLPETVPASTEGGRATQGAAIALLGKVYLEQEKFVPAAEQFAKVNGETPGAANSKYGYALLDNYGDLWRVDNEYNSESIFEVGHTSKSNATWDNIGGAEGNIMNIMMNPRSYTITEAGEALVPDLVSGWSFNPVTQSLVDAFKLPGGAYDPRYKFTVLNADSLKAEGLIDYTPAWENTGYFVLKFAGYTKDRSTSGGNYELNFPQNVYEIRLADTYLMEAEALVRGGGNATRAEALLNAVRARVGLESVPATFDNIMHERRVELAAEGHRWFDLVRTGRAAAALADKGYVEGKHDKLPLPLSEVNNSTLQQDPAY